MADTSQVFGQSTTNASGDDSGKPLLEAIKATGGSLHTSPDLAFGEDPTNDTQWVTEDADQYETVSASASDQIMGASGALGDYLKRVIVCISTSGANGTCSIKDGNGSAIVIVPASSPIGTYIVDLGITCVAATTPGWKITTGSAATALGIGRFT